MENNVIPMPGPSSAKRFVVADAHGQPWLCDLAERKRYPALVLEEIPEDILEAYILDLLDAGRRGERMLASDARLAVKYLIHCEMGES
jgi:hypothetical protein